MGMAGEAGIDPGAGPPNVALCERRGVPNVLPCDIAGEGGIELLALYIDVGESGRTGVSGIDGVWRKTGVCIALLPRRTPDTYTSSTSLATPEVEFDQAPPTNDAAEREAGDSTSSRFFDDANPCFEGTGGPPRACSQRRHSTVGQNRGMRTGSSSDKCRSRMACAAAGSVTVCAPNDVLCGCGSPRKARMVQKGNTSMNSIMFRRPLGWKNETNVEGMPKPIRYDQCDSANRRRFSIDQPRTTHTCSKQKYPSTNDIRRNAHAGPIHGTI